MKILHDYHTILIRIRYGVYSGLVAFAHVYDSYKDLKLFHDG